MSTKRINIKSIVLGIIGIAICISIGYGIARANVSKAPVGLETRRELSLRSALLPAGLKGEKALLKGASLKSLKLKGEKADALKLG